MKNQEKIELYEVELTAEDERAITTYVQCRIAGLTKENALLMIFRLEYSPSMVVFELIGSGEIDESVCEPTDHLQDLEEITFH